MIANPSMAAGAEHYTSTSQGVSIAKRSSSLVGAGAVTVGLLFVMTQLINSDMPALEEKQTLEPINFAPPIVEKDVEVIKPIRPKIKEQPKAVKKDFTTPTALIDGDIHIGDPEPSPPMMDFDEIGLPGGSSLVPISPQYPERAAQMGLCGRVLVQFDISTEGIPVNVVVAETSHKVFNRSALQAVKRARYKPTVNGGKATMITGKQERIVFQLEEGC